MHRGVGMFMYYVLMHFQTAQNLIVLFYFSALVNTLVQNKTCIKKEDERQENFIWKNVCITPRE